MDRCSNITKVQTNITISPSSSSSHAESGMMKNKTELSPQNLAFGPQMSPLVYFLNPMATNSPAACLAAQLGTYTQCQQCNIKVEVVKCIAK